MWAQVLPKIKLHPQAAVRSGGQIGWAVRKSSPQLVAAIDDFFNNDMKKSSITQQLVNTYTKRVKQFRSPAEEADRKRCLLYTASCVEETGASATGWCPVAATSPGASWPC